MFKFDKLIYVTGMPRSGTSFMGQIFDSHPDTVFRMEPLFAYKLKNMVNAGSSKEEFVDFFNKAYDSFEDEFMNQSDKRLSGSYPNFIKNKQSILVIKTTRFHNLLETLMKHFTDEQFYVISVVRNPAGMIYSWINHPIEFPQVLNYKAEWKYGLCRKTAEEEFWGFADWVKITSIHQELEKQFVDKFRIIQYEYIVRNLRLNVEALFKFTGLEMNSQTEEFIKDCQNKHNDDPYAVYKDKSVADKWKNNLDADIIDEIYDCVKGTHLEKFLVG